MSWWHEPSHLRDLVLCTRFLSKNVRYANNLQGYETHARGLLGDLYQECWDIYGHVMLVPSPLVWLQQTNRGDKIARMGDGRRQSLLADLEDLTARLWHGAPAVTMDDLVARLAEDELKARVSDQVKLETCGFLLGFVDPDFDAGEARFSE